jgi:hypothetical protein
MLAKAAGVSLRSVQRILDVFELLGELRIVGQLERADAMRRELVGNAIEAQVPQAEGDPRHRRQLCHS